MFFILTPHFLVFRNIVMISDLSFTKLLNLFGYNLQNVLNMLAKIVTKMCKNQQLQSLISSMTFQTKTTTNAKFDFMLHQCIKNRLKMQYLFKYLQEIDAIHSFFFNFQIQTKSRNYRALNHKLFKTKRLYFCYKTC